MTRKRRPWVAAVLSLVLPGLGQLYAGHAAAALAGYAATACGAAFMLAMWLWAPGGPVPILLGVLVAVATYLAVAIHAWVIAGRWPAEFELRPYNRWYVYIGVYVMVRLLLGSALQERLKQRVEAFRIPSAAMQPTLLIGDYLYVLKTPAARTNLTHESVVVFESVDEPGLKVIKRVLGLPGDTLSMSSGALHRNGRPLEEPYVVHLEKARTEDAEQRGRMRSWQVAHTVALDTAAYAPDLQDWGPLVVPADSLFALGDNRDASYDSRYYGFIPMSHVLGQPRVIYLSLEQDTSGSHTGLRWARIGARVR
ncbi:MAG TPA: signal peptidase I [Gemmatimonadales bacterium]|nr:signal peptidase I [Gemmatimonadales bacterium]